MQAIPTTTKRRVLALLWLVACSALLVFAYVQRDAHEMPEVFTWGLVALTFPIGLPVGAIVGLSMSQAYANWGLPYSPFLDLLPSWVVMVAFGYLQWFVIVPRLAQRFFRGRPRP